MGLVKSFKCIILYMGSFLSWGMHFFFPHRCRFIASTDANGNHRFLLVTGPQKVTQILLPSSQVGNGFSQNNRVHVSEVPRSKEGLAARWRDCCAKEACGDLGRVIYPLHCRFFTCKSRTNPPFPAPVFLKLVATGVSSCKRFESYLMQSWVFPASPPSKSKRDLHSLGFAAWTSAQAQFLRPDTAIAQRPEWKLSRSC